MLNHSALGSLCSLKRNHRGVTIKQTAWYDDCYATAAGLSILNAKTVEVDLRYPSL